MVIEIQKKTDGNTVREVHADKDRGTLPCHAHVGCRGVSGDQELVSEA